MKLLRIAWMGALAVVGAGAYGQAWSTSYEAGLKAAKAGDWVAARNSFMQASANRPEDSAKPTRLPGPITDQREWRGGSPYSPNFLAAYCELKAGLAQKDAPQQTAMVQAAADEFLALVDRGQACQETLFYLNACLSKLGQSPKAQALAAKVAKPGFKFDWVVDTDPIDPQELAAARSQHYVVAPAPTPQVKPGKKPDKPKAIAPGQPVPAEQVNPRTGEPVVRVTSQPTSNPNVDILTLSPVGPLGGVPIVASKFALIIGNGAGQVNGEDVITNSPDDASMIRDTLVQSAGYAESNVELVLNGTVQQIRDRAKLLADRMADGSTVMIYFSGVGINTGGKDYLAGVDSSAPDSMIAKSDLYRIFIAKGAHIFAFFQANRPMKDGNCFGQEIPPLGAISQAQATVPGDRIFTTIHNGRPVGIYSQAFAGVLNEFRSNQIPIDEFGWQVFYRVRRGDTGSSGGSSLQTPTLPYRNNLAADARF